MTQTVPDISPLMPMHQDPLLVVILEADINSLRPNDAIWWHKSGSIFIQVIACTLRHYLNQCWLVRFRSVHLRRISQRLPEISLSTMSFKFILLKLLPHPRGVNVLTLCPLIAINQPTPKHREMQCPIADIYHVFTISFASNFKESLKGVSYIHSSIIIIATYTVYN